MPPGKPRSFAAPGALPASWGHLFGSFYEIFWTVWRPIASTVFRVLFPNLLCSRDDNPITSTSKRILVQSKHPNFKIYTTNPVPLIMNICFKHANPCAGFCACVHAPSQQTGTRHARTWTKATHHLRHFLLCFVLLLDWPRRHQSIGASRNVADASCFRFARNVFSRAAGAPTFRHFWRSASPARVVNTNRPLTCMVLLCARKRKSSNFENWADSNAAKRTSHGTRTSIYTYQQQPRGASWVAA